MKTLKFRDIIIVLTKNGFAVAHQKGSHARYKGMVNGEEKNVTVQTNHLSDDVDPGTLNSIIRQSGLGKSAFK